MRRNTTAVKIGNLTLSSEQPVMIQSMLNTSTMDTNACVEQAIRIIDAGGQLVRITAPGVREAENLKVIRQALSDRGYDTPVSADIHFTPEAALVAAQYVEKVRINPGNFVDRRATFQQLDYTDEEYGKELKMLREKFTEFLQVCRKNRTAVRIGTNHGSLSDRIMSRYGDTPAGMVEATMEYLRVCKAEHFEDVVISLKSSDCRVMVDAVRLLVRVMKREGMHYPLHLGVTEAGEGEDGRIRSAVGIGTLLNEGIGDTIRVSLTEEPEAEIPVAKALTEICCSPIFEKVGEPLQGDCTKPLIVADLTDFPLDDELFPQLGFTGRKEDGPACRKRFEAGLLSPEIVYVPVPEPELARLPEETVVVVPSEMMGKALEYNLRAVPLYNVEQYLSGESTGVAYLQINTVEELDEVLTARLRQDDGTVLVLSFPPEYHFFHEAFRAMKELGITNKAIVNTLVGGRDKNEISLTVASQVGGFFLDRLAWGLWISAPEVSEIPFTLGLSRNILQSAGVRRYKAEFISCPGCGRTLFDLQGAVAKVKAAFGHLNTLKIAVMGCIVNGPGEMGDADYGYVGAGNGKVNLYRRRQIVRAAVPEDEAIEALRKLIEEDK